jgi:hypothetical protein
VPGCHSVMQDALDIGLCSSRWLWARIFFRRSSRGRKFIKPRCSSSGRIALPLKQSAHMASPSITAAAGTSMPARRRCAAQKYFSITHLLRGPGREPIGNYQKTIIRSGRTFEAGREDGRGALAQSENRQGVETAIASGKQVVGSVPFCCPRVPLSHRLEFF